MLHFGALTRAVGLLYDQRRRLCVLMVATVLLLLLTRPLVDLSQTHLVFFRKHQQLIVGPRYLVLASGRSGSTFAAELLTLNDNINYMFEPLGILKLKSTLGYKNTAEADAVSNLLKQLLQCKQLLSIFVGRLKFVNKDRFNLTSCEQNPMVVKTIRIHGLAIGKTMQLNPTLKVVHLVRDPRAIIQSRNKVKWSSPIELTCTEMTNDLDNVNNISNSADNQLRWLERYMLVRYEDLVDRNSSTVHRLYRFLDMPLNQSLLDAYYENHYRSDLEIRDLFGTVQSSQFDPNHWRQTLDLRTIREIEAECSSVMQRYGYDKFVQKPE